jgi:hypothetical protein
VELLLQLTVILKTYVELLYTGKLLYERMLGQAVIRANGRYQISR